MAELSRRVFLKQSFSAAASFGAASLLAGCQQQQNTGRTKRPNIVMIVSDDQAYGDMSCYDNPILKTPNLDTLFSQSTRLTNYIVSPLCAPTRASLMTGRYNYRTGVWDTWMGRLGIHTDEVTFAQLLKDNGYATGLFGKWHLGENIPMRPDDKGFDETLLYADSLGERFDPQMNHNGTLVRMNGFFDDIFTDHAIDFIKQNKKRPFLLCVMSFLPHDGKDPQVAPEYVEPYADAPNLTQGDKDVYGMVAKLDENIGKLLKTLKNEGLEDDTIVIFFSDNGPLLYCADLKSNPEILACQRKKMGVRYNCGLRGGKTTVYEGGINVPCFVRWPGKIEAGRDVDELCAHIDMLPTIMAFCGLKMPSDLDIDGISIADVLTGTTKTLPDRSIIIQSDRVEKPRMWINSCVRQKRYKLINGEALYDLKTDPAEQNNIAEQNPKIVKELRGIYEDWYKDVTKNDPFMPGRTTIGSPKQETIRFNIHHRHSTGWPIKVVNEGPYRITITDIEHNLFKKGGQFSLRFGQYVLKGDVDPSSDSIVFENVKLSEGKMQMDIQPPAQKEPAKMYYGNEDFGYRDIVIALK